MYILTMNEWMKVDEMELNAPFFFDGQITLGKSRFEITINLFFKSYSIAAQDPFRVSKMTYE